MTRYGGVHLIAVAAVPLLVVAGCTRQQEGETVTTRGETTHQADASLQDDRSLTTAIQARLYADDTLRGEDVDVRVAGGIATLTGEVETQAREQQALNIARSVEGVTRVEDQITVRGAERADAGNRDREVSPTTGVDATTPGWITTKIHAQYFLDPDVKPWNIDVTTSAGGIVELRGEVDNANAKAEAVRIARDTEGVTRVDDRLRVAPGDAARGEVDTSRGGEPDASDPWLTAKIQSKYFLDTDIKGLDIDVTARDGTVTLRGTVDSERERRQAVAIARNTDGVRQVNDELQMRSDAAGTDRRDAPTDTSRARGTTGSNVAAGVEDAWITTKIQSQYFLDREVKGHEIDVDTSNTVVTLTGTVESNARKELAERIARETEGVSRVINRLSVAAER
jgi:osmotically-inducible protein OsmY